MGMFVTVYKLGSDKRKSRYQLAIQDRYLDMSG